MKLVSWNVNGIRAAVRHGFMDDFKKIDADVFCVNETKLQNGQIELDTPDYHQYWNYADKKGYSGTAIFTKEKPLEVSYGLGIDELDHEGRVITLEFENCYLISCYVPNSQPKLKRLDFRRKWNQAFLEYVNSLKETKPVVLCGDLNVAHEAIDLKNDKANHQHPGFSDEEREDFSRLLDSGFTDTYRYLYPNKEGEYSWWSYMGHARDRNAGWRIDYFVVSNDLQKKIQDAKILNDVYGSDHCPIELDLDIE